LTWFPGSGGQSSKPSLSHSARHEPFTPHIPRFIIERPAVLGAILASFGIGSSVLIIQTMHRWPVWMIFPSMALAVLAMAATVVGLVILVVLALQPLIEAKQDLGWDAEPLASMGIPLTLQRKCEALGYWTCEALAQAIDKGLFPWNDLNYDERQQIHRAIQFWRATTVVAGD
jgi:hypothetical protein